MENSSRVMLMMSVMVLGMLSLWPMVVMGKPVLHKVGGSKGWNENVNYTIWSSQQHVYVDDWLSKSLNIYFFLNYVSLVHIKFCHYQILLTLLHKD
jgi:hypothetical protein